MSNTTTEQAAAFVAPIAPEPELAELWSRSIASDQDRAHWLQARRPRITGTDQCVIGRARPQTLREHMRKKATGTDSEFRGNKATEWGHYREAMIVADLDGAGWHRCGLLIAASFNPRITCTPDLVGVNFDGELEVMEVKTSAKDLHPDGPDFKGTRYLEQVLGELIATGAVRVRLRVEQHDDDWSRWQDRPRDGWEYADGTTLADYGPRVVATHEYVFERSAFETEIAELIAKDEAALIVLDEELSGFIADGPEAFTQVESREYGTEARRYAEGMALEKRGKELKAEAQAELLTLAAEQERKAFSERFDNIKVTYSPAEPAAMVTAPDENAARAANPQAWDRLEQAKAALTAAQDQWAAVLAEHTHEVEGKASQAKVTVTPPRGWTAS